MRTGQLLLQEFEPLQRHACFRRAVGLSPQCRIQGTVVSVIIVFVLDFFVLVLVNEFNIFSFLPTFVFVNENHSGRKECFGCYLQCHEIERAVYGSKGRSTKDTQKTIDLLLS